VLAAAGVPAGAIVLLNDSGSSGPPRNDTGAAYAGKVAATFAPVDAANRALSDSLRGLRRGHGSAAQDAVARAQTATSAARGALGAVAVPAGSQDLAAQMRQALDRETTYLSAVNLALAHPSNPGVAQLQSIAGTLTSTLEAIGAPIPGASQNVTGADKLTAWAQRTARAAAQRRRNARRVAATPAPAPQPAATPANAPSGGVCPSGERVNATTTCEFATNVHSGWLDTPGISNTVSAFSAATGRTITMDCGPSSGGSIVCTGGENAYVSW
jgi:hypothetical protein